MEPLIQLHDISKCFGKTEAVKNVSMSVEEGEIYGFLGRNGAGKTTIMKMILNLVKPDNGWIRVCGENVEKNSYRYLKEIGSIIEYPVFYEKLSAKKNMMLHCEYMGFYDKNKIEETLSMVGLGGVEHKPVSSFSLGMKQRLGIARAIITRPKLLLLDEPINGLDPVGIKEVRELLLKLKHDFATTILISSHILSEMEQVADRIGILKEGELIREVSMEEMKREAMQYLEIEVDDIQKAVMVLEEKFDGMKYKIVDQNRVRIYENIEQKVISKAFILHEIGILNITCQSNSLEEYFLDFMGE